MLLIIAFGQTLARDRATGILGQKILQNRGKKRQKPNRPNFAHVLPDPYAGCHWCQRGFHRTAGNGVEEAHRTTGKESYLTLMSTVQGTDVCD